MPTTLETACCSPTDRQSASLNVGDPHRVMIVRNALRLVAFSIAYLFIAGATARIRPLWTDELFTWHLSRFSSLTQFWESLATGGDQHPPLFYLIEHVSLRIFGASEFGLRVPSLAGFLLACLSLFAFVARRTSALFGFVAALLLVSFGAYYYAYEARGYALVLGLVSLALLCWQLAGERPRSLYSVPGLALSLALAVGCHYYAILVLPALACGELVRSRRTGRLAPSVWLALTAPGLTLAICLPFILAARQFSGTFWAIPRWADLFWIFSQLIGSEGVQALVLCTLGLCVTLVVRPPGLTLPAQATTFQRHPEDLFVAWGLMLVPLLGMILAQTVTGGFVARYVLSAVLGLTILCAFALHELVRSRPATGPVVCGLLIAWSLVAGINHLANACLRRVELGKKLTWFHSEIKGDLPVVCSNSDTYYVLSRYGSRKIRDRLHYLADTKRSVQYLKHDTVDRCLLTLHPWFGMRVDSYTEFPKTHPRFLLVGEIDPNWQWLPRALADDGFTMQLLTLREGKTFVFLVERPSTRTSAPAISQN